jgi:Trp operon repressor
MKIRAKDLDPKVRAQVVHTLDTVATAVQGKDATKNFLRDVLTESERIMVGRRLLIAHELLTGKTYDDIASRLRVGYDTIGRIDGWLKNLHPATKKRLQALKIR